MENSDLNRGSVGLERIYMCTN